MRQAATNAFRIGDDMVGGEREHHRLVAAPQRMQRAGDDRRRGIAAMRLEQNVGLDADLGELLGDQKPIGMIGDDDRAGRTPTARRPGAASPETSSVARAGAETAWAAPRARPATNASRPRRT